MAATAKDVAKRAGVSAATVSRVLNHDPRISAATRDKVMESVEALGYRINSLARGLKTSRTFTVGLVSPEIPNDFFMYVAKGVEDELKKYHYSLVICNANEDIREEEARLQLLIDQQVDGVIVIPSGSVGAHFSRLKDAGIPLVLVDRLVEDFVTDAVLVDNVGGSYDTTAWLLERGIRRIGFIGGDNRLTNARERFEGYKRAMEDYGLRPDESLIRSGDFHAGSGHALMKELCSLDRPPEYVFVANYFMHVGATKYMMENYARLDSLPRLASFDDMELSSMLGFARVRVRQPMAEIGTVAAELLLRRMQGDEDGFPALRRLKTTLIFDDN